MIAIRFVVFNSSDGAHTPLRFLFAFRMPTAVLLHLTSRPYFSPIFSGIVRQGAVTRSISRRLLYPFVSILADCRHLEGAVNLQCYSVLLHSIRLLILVGYQPNDKERIVVPSCQYHRCLLLTLSMLTSRLRGVIWMHDFKELLYRCTTPYIQTKYQKRKSASTIA